MFKRAEGAVEVKKFGYGPLNGPFNWASLAPENEACKSGVNQSPINIDASVTRAPSKPVLNIPKASVEFENLGTTIEVITNGTTTYAGTDFRLVQFHIHTPSEHHINGEYHALEIHMVHQGVVDNTKLAVIALMFQVTGSTSSSIIKSIAASVPKIAAPGSKTTIAGGIDYKDVISKIQASDILQYSGSLTTPPCAEGVTFLIVKDPLNISAADYNSIKKVVKFNSRFIQNSLGQANMLDVGARSGTPNASKPVAAREAAPAPGTEFLVTEIEGKPTSIPAVVVKRTPKYS